MYTHICPHPRDQDLGRGFQRYPILFSLLLIIIISSSSSSSSSGGSSSSSSSDSSSSSSSSSITPHNQILPDCFTPPNAKVERDSASTCVLLSLGSHWGGGTKSRIRCQIQIRMFVCCGRASWDVFLGFSMPRGMWRLVCKIVQRIAATMLTRNMRK